VTTAPFEELKFGETSLATVRRILSHLPPLDESSVAYDLGCGRGRFAFLLHFLTGATVLALDAVPFYIDTGRKLAQWNGCDAGVLFYWEDFRHSSLEPADLFFANALCFGVETRQSILSRVLESKPGCHLVSVGWRAQHPRLELITHFTAPFSWGPAPVTINRLRDDAPFAVDGEVAVSPADDVAPQRAEPEA
jgi:trans-aconitate methyltransferase